MLGCVNSLIKRASSLGKCYTWLKFYCPIFLTIFTEEPNKHWYSEIMLTWSFLSKLSARNTNARIQGILIYLQLLISKIYIFNTGSFIQRSEILNTRDVLIKKLNLVKRKQMYTIWNLQLCNTHTINNIIYFHIDNKLGRT